MIINIILFVFSDVQHLINITPSGSKRKASNLLKKIESLPNELTFDSFGRIIINGVGIPGSNIYVIFPLLFKNKKESSLIGFKELKKKIEDMGFGDDIKTQVGRGKEKAKFKQTVTFEPSSASYQPWYYLGP